MKIIKNTDPQFEKSPSRQSRVNEWQINTWWIDRWTDNM